MKKYETHSPEETRRLGFETAKSLKPGDILALIGGLGCGKTHFVKGVVDNCFGRMNAERFLANRGQCWKNLSSEQE